MARRGGVRLSDRPAHHSRRRLRRGAAAPRAAERARVPSLAVTPTNLVFNVVAVPGGLLRFWHERRLFNSLSALLITGTCPA